jgi:hypothetical protein
MKTLAASVPFGLGFALASVGVYDANPWQWMPGVILMLAGTILLWLWADNIEGTEETR